MSARAAEVQVVLLESHDRFRSRRALASSVQQSLDGVAIERVPPPRGDEGNDPILISPQSVRRANEIMSATSAEFVSIIDGGGSWHPRFLEHMVGHLKTHPEQAAAVTLPGVTYLERVNDIETDVEHQSAQSRSQERDTLAASDLLLVNMTPFHGLVVRRSSAVEAGLLDTQLVFATDWDFGLRLLRVGPIGIVRTKMDLATSAVTTTAQSANLPARARAELSEKAIRLAVGTEMLYGAILSAQATSAMTLQSPELQGRIARIESSVGLIHKFLSAGLEVRVRRYLRALPGRIARRLGVPRRVGHGPRQ